MPTCWIIAGPNGAGKTTFATEFLPAFANCTNFLNPDLLAHGFSPFDQEAGMYPAAKALLQRVAEFRKTETDFALETTLSGRTYLPIFRAMKEEGFKLNMFYIWVPSPELSLLRIQTRVETGGHNVPEADVRRRFDRTLTNLFSFYRPLLDTLHFFDNSSEVPRLVFKDEAEETEVYDKALYAHLKRRFER